MKEILQSLNAWQSYRQKSMIALWACLPCNDTA